MTKATAIESTESATAGSAVVVVASSHSSRAAALALARSLNLPFDDAGSSAGLRLVQTDSRLELHDPISGARLYVHVTEAELQRYRGGGTGGDPFRRAIGPAGRHVADATAGLGGDAVHLAALGYRVAAVERDPIVSALAQDGLRRARAERLLSDNPAWHTADARAILPALRPAPDTIYLDPMFPAKRKKSAAVRKEMHLLRLLVGEQGDAAELLAVARHVATDRVVVKRPLDAAPLAPGPSASHAGKLIRYDVYRTRQRG
jgi:16S rRNA (guanine1516-N2)-methyltransferase